MLAAQADQLIVSGKLIAKETGEELIGAQIAEVDKNDRIITSTITDFSGNFSLQIRNVNNVLRFTYVGFKKQVLPIKDRRKFDIGMQDDTTIEEVVVTGKRVHWDGTLPIPQREVSGAVQRISTKDFEGLSVTSIDDALQGRIAGLDIVGNSGDLGSGSTMRIRGITSINSNSEPLIVLNDVPFENNVNKSFDFSTANSEQFANLLSVNPDDIEDITVLKDGAAAAIWGSRGANGVIMIKTKKGVKGPTRVQYSYYLSGHKQPKGMKMLNGDDYTMLMKQAYFNPAQSESAANIPEFNYDPTFSEYQNFNNNTDWVDKVTQYGISNKHYLTVSGGGDKALFRASVGYDNENGTVIKQNLQRISSRMYLEYAVSNRLKFISDFSFTSTDNSKNYESEKWDDLNKSLLDIAYKKMPNVSVYKQDENGNDTGSYYSILKSSRLDASQKDLMNPVALANLASFKEKNIRVIPTLRLQYDILDPLVTRLRYNGYVSFDLTNDKQTKYLPKEVSGQEWNGDLANRAYGKEQDGLSISMDHNVTYIPNLGDKHSLMVYGGFQLTSGKSQYQTMEKIGLPGSINESTSEGFSKEFDSGVGEWRKFALLGRVHYSYLGRYIFDATLRRDGSTRFGPNNRWGYFPGVSGKWIISDEAFMKQFSPWLSEFAVRPGWGVTGQEPDKDYLYFSRYGSNWTENTGGNYMDLATAHPTSLRLANLKWEKNSSYNLGFDLHLFDYKYSMDFNVYYRRTDGLLFKDQNIPSSSGFGQIPYINGGIMDNKGWEFNMSTNKMLKINDFSVDFNLNLSNNINEIIELDNTVLNGINSTFDYKNGSYLTRIQEGNSLGSIYGFRYKGVYQYDEYQEGRDGTSPVAKDAQGNVIKDGNGNPVPMYFGYGSTNYRFRGGDAIYEDVNNDGTIDELDIVYLGNSNPKLNGGFGTKLQYKNFTVNAFFNFRLGSKILNIARMNAESMYTNDNQSTAVNWRWRKDGDVTEIPRALYQYGYNYLGSDRFVEDGSFLRFKYLTFGYAFDQKVLRPIGLNQLTLNLTLNNLVTFTKYTGVDPEVSPGDWNVSRDESKTPRSRYFTFSVNVGF